LLRLADYRQFAAGEAESRLNAYGDIPEPKPFCSQL
jgi:hypothetical protein